MTKDRVRQLSEQLAVKLALVPGDHESYEGDIAFIESAILAALDEHDSEEPSEEMLDAIHCANPDAEPACERPRCTYCDKCGREYWKAMSAVRRAALQSSKPEG